LYLNLGTVISAMFFLMFGAPESVPQTRSSIPIYYQSATVSSAT
jgi:hypothetical protein